jgi:predicted transcriptional regulator
MEIFMDILEAVTDRKFKPTHIMYRANLSWPRLKKHLNLLVSQGLLEESDMGSATTYTITTGVSEVLGYFKKIERGLYQRNGSLPAEIHVINEKVY